MKIDELPKGRALDALVAEKVLGCKLIPYPNPDYRDKEPVTCGCPGMDHRQPDQFDDLLCEYSSDILDAWEVVEQFERWKIHILRSSQNRWRVRLLGDFEYVGHDNLFEVEERSAPLAICLAALRAVGVLE